MIFNWNGYPVDSAGNIYSKRNNTKRLTPHLNHKGYPMVGVMVEGELKKVTVHKVVTEVFLGKRPKGFQVDHIDNNRWNFHPSNLRYVTPSENVKKSYKEGVKDHSGFNASSSKYTPTQLRGVLQMINAGLQNKEILCTGVKLGTIKKLRKGTHFFCKFYKIKYD